MNLDYKSEATVGVVGPGDLETFDAASGGWSSPSGKNVELHLPPGGGKLVRVAQSHAQLVGRMHLCDRSVANRLECRRLVVLPAGQEANGQTEQH